MKDVMDGLKDLYRDFYGEDSEYNAIMKDIVKDALVEMVGPDSPEVKAFERGEGIGLDVEEPNKVRKFKQNSQTPDPKAGAPGKGATSEGDADKEATAETAAEAEKPKEPEKSGMEELNELIGLATVKHDVKELVALAKVRKLREERGMKPVPVSLHLVFSGNPGTGKTTVARILAKLYKEIGILEKGQLIETDRSGLVAGYVGQTAIKTRERIDEAMGGVLFIDEAYALNKEGENYGQEAIDTILKAMEDHRDKFVVIVAGYTELMKEFIDSNPGLKSRFNKFFEFQDYTVDELQAIFKLQCDKYQYKLTEEAEAAVRDEIIMREAAKGENFANAREVRNLFEKIITNQAARVAELEDVDEETLTTITVYDLEDLEDTPEADADTSTADKEQNALIVSGE